MNQATLAFDDAPPFDRVVSRRGILACALAIAAVFAADTLTPRGIGLALLYLPILWAALLWTTRRQTLALAAACSVLTFLALGFESGGNLRTDIINRFLVLIALWFLAYFGSAYRRMVDTVRAREMELADFIENAAVGMHWLDPDGTIVWANRQQLEMLNYRREDFVGRNIAGFHADPPAYEEIRNRWHDGLGLIDVPVRLRAGDGSTRDLVISSSFQRRADTIIRVRCFTRDVTDRRRADEAERSRDELGAINAQLRTEVEARRRLLTAREEAERRYRELVAAVPAIVWRADARTFRFSFVSDQAETMLGYPVWRWLDEPGFWREHLHPEDREAAVQYCVEATRELRPHEFEYRMIASNGGIVWLRDLVRVEARNDEPNELFGVMIDITKQKEIETRLREREDLLRLTFNQAPDGIAIIGPDGRFREVNLAYRQMLGYTEEELHCTTAMEITHEDDRARNLALRDELRAGQRDSYELEKRYYLKDGNHIWVRTKVSAVRDGGGNLRFTVGITHDITKQKRIELNLLDSEWHYRHLFEANPMPMWITHDDTLQVLHVNEAAVRLYGYGRDEFSRMTAFDFQTAEGVASYQKFAAQRRTRDGTTYRRTKHRRKSGSLIDVDVTSHPITYGGSPARLVIAQDITERLRAEAALRDREALLSVMIDRAPIGVNIVTPDGRFLRANSAFTQMMGYSEAELGAMSPFDLTHPDDLPLNRRLREELLEGKRDLFEIEKRYRTKDSREIWVRNRVSLVKDADGNPKFTVAAVQDITEIKRAEAERERAFRAKAELAAIVENATVAIFTRTLEGTILSWNPGAEKMLGYGAADAMGRNADFCLPPERRSNLRENNERLQHDEVSVRESQRITSKGQVIDVLASFSPIRNEAGSIVGVSVILQDVTALKRAQAVAQEREEQFFKMFRSSPIATSISTLDDGRFIDVNDSFVELFGFRREELIGNSGTALGLWVDLGRRSALRAQLRAGEPVRNVETQFRRKSGEIVTALYSREVLQFGDRRVSFAMRVDITERKRAEQELERKTTVARLLESLARAVNEAITPGSAIETCLELMCRHGTWDLGHFAMTPTETDDGRTHISVWHDPGGGGQFAGFVQRGDDVLGASHRRGGRFATVAIAERRPVWIPDVSSTEGLFRLRFAAQAGLRAAFGFPVFVQDQLAAFVEFFSVDARQPDDELLAAGSIIAAQLARLIERDRAFQATARLATIFEHAPSGIVQSDTREFRVTAANPAFARMLGYNREELIGMPVRTFAHPAEPTDIEVNRRLMMQGQLDRVAGEQMMRRKDGSTIWVNRTVVPVRLASGDTRHFVGVYEDITERKASEAALRESEEQMRLFMQATTDCLWNWDLITGNVARSIGFNRILGYAEQEIDSSITWWEERLHPDDQERILSKYQATVASGGHTCSYEYRFRRKDDTYAVIHDQAYIVRDAKGVPIRALGAMTDITERKASETALREYSERLQVLSRKVMEAQERERAAIARELHDQLGQLLSAAKLNLQVFQRRHNAASAAAGVKESIQTVDQALKQVRTLALDLRPPQLDELGLGSTLRSYAERLAKPARLKLHFSAGRLPKLPSQTDIACFRVAQGALTNVVRHAGATNVWVTLAVDHGMLCLRVRDDGEGCDLKRVQRQAERGRSMGLLSMEERTRLTGGRFTIVTGPGSGMEIHADFPLEVDVDRPAAMERSA